MIDAGRAQAVFCNKPYDNNLYLITVHENQSEHKKDQISMINDQKGRINSQVIKHVKCKYK